MHKILKEYGFIVVDSGPCGGSIVEYWGHPEHRGLEIEIRPRLKSFDIWDGRIGRMLHETDEAKNLTKRLNELLAPIGTESKL